MTAENPVRPAGETGIKNWSSAKEALVSSSGGMISQELGLPFPRNKFSRNRKDTAPNRSGSAPPSIEVVLNNHFGQRYPSPVGGTVRSTNNELYTNEELLRSDPSYVAYYISNVNLNPRLPPPITLREARHMAQHASHSGEDWRSSSHDDGSTGPLPTHREEHDNALSAAQVANGDSERIISGNSVSSLEGRHKSLVDLIQEDFPRTPSPVYSNPIRSSNRGSTEDVADFEAHPSPLQDSSVTTGKLLKLGGHSAATALDTRSRESTRNTASSAKSSSKNVAGEHANPERVSVVNSTDASVAVVNQGTVEGALRGLSIASQNDGRHLRLNTQPSNSRLQGAISQLDIPQSHGVVPAHNIFDQFSHDQWKLHLVDKKPVLQATGTTPHLYSAAGFLTGNPFYCNVQQSGVYVPPYSTGGYAVNTSPFTPFVAGYHPAVAIPMTIESPTAVAVNVTDGNVPTNVDMQHLYKYYAQLGVVLPPPFSDSMYTPYIHHPTVGAYGPSSHHDPANRGYDAHKLPPTYSPDQMHLRSGNTSIPSPIKVGIPSPSNYANPPNIGIVMQYPTSPLASLQMSGSPLAVPAPAIRRPESINSPVCSVKNTGPYSGWQVLRGHEKLTDSKTHSILEELKSNKARRFELSDVAGRVAEFSTDQHGSRFIQQKLETCTSEEKASVFKEVLPHATVLMNDVFGNYVIQKFFEHGNSEQRKELANQLVGSVLPLSLQMYGCRVIQKVFWTPYTDEIRAHLPANSLEGEHIWIAEVPLIYFHIVEYYYPDRFKRQFGGLQDIPSHCSTFPELHAIDLRGKVLVDWRAKHKLHIARWEEREVRIIRIDRSRGVFATPAYEQWYRTITRRFVGRLGATLASNALEVIELNQKTQLVSELDGHVMRCVRDQNGNHVIQKCIECVPTDRIVFIMSAFHGQVANLSMHPYGCRVIQRVLEHCNDEVQTQCIVDEILASGCLLAQDQYGNYVIQHVLERGRPHERGQIISKLAGQVLQMSQHKFASNVIEKCLEHGDSAERELLIEEIVGETEGNDVLLTMMKDQFANYVVQKILETCNHNQQEILLNRIRVHLPALKRYTYGKHIVARVEQLCGEEARTASE